MMKKYFLSLIAFIILGHFFTSCSKIELYSRTETPYHYGILEAINDTMTNHPEDALMLLKKIDDAIVENDFTAQEYHEYQILLSESYYKNYYEQTNHNEIILASRYFDSLVSLYPRNNEIAYLSSKAHYYLAVGLEELEKTKDAFKCYLNALETLDKIDFKKKKICSFSNAEILHFKALIYTRISDILYWHDAFDAAISSINDANNLFLMENNQNALSRNNIILAIIYGLNNDHDKALYHLSIADSIPAIDEIGSTLKDDIDRIKAHVMYNIGYKDEAFKIILNQFKTLDNPIQIMEAAGILGDMYYDKKNYDSAVYYYEKYFPYNKFSKINAANNIIEIGIITDNKELITKYAPSLAEETNKEIMLSSIKTELTYLYNQYNTKKNNNNLYNRIFKNLILLSTITVAIFVFGLNIIKLRKRKYSNEISEKSSYINALQRKIDKTSSENKHIKLQIKNLEDELTNIKSKNVVDHVSFEDKIDSIKNNPLYKKLYDIGTSSTVKTNTEYPDLQLNDVEQKKLIELFNTTFDNGFENIISEHRGLKHHDLLYFCLYIIGLDEKHISAVTGKTYNAVWNRTRKIQEILGSDKKIKDIVKSKLGY